MNLKSGKWDDNLIKFSVDADKNCATIKKVYEEEAKMFCDAIKSFAENPDALENFESYLSFTFGLWLKKYVNTPENIASEMMNFATIDMQ